MPAPRFRRRLAWPWAVTSHGEDFKVVAVIGDGALTGGMALEAINNAGTLKKNVIFVLNDNDKSISENVGAIHKYLGKLRSNRLYRKLRGAARQSLANLPMVGELAVEMAGRADRSMKEFWLPSKSGVIFAELGLTFLGPFDGHDIPLMVEVFQRARSLRGR